MKFMKLGSKPDTFQDQGKGVRYVSSELATDVTIIVGEVIFYLHKFPLLSMSNKLQKLVSKANEENSDVIQLVDFPGGPRAFEICAKFCYGMTVTLNPYNVVAARCAAEYLEMAEEVDRGNLIFKIEVFLNSSVFRSWKDSIIVLQTTKSLRPWSEDLKVVGRCIDSIASKTSMDPSSITWSYTYNRKVAVSDKITEVGMKFPGKLESVPKDWWVEDICELEIDLYKRVMVAVKSKGRMDGSVIGEALRTYAMRWLPNSIEALVSEAHSRRNKSLLETIICLLPYDKGVTCSCCFLLKLLKVAILVGADDSSRDELVKSISLKLDEASVNDLLIPARSPQATVYDVELVKCLVNRFMARERSSRDKNIPPKSTNDFILGHASWLKVGKLIDGYLAEIARDPNVSLSIFIELLQSIPDSARPIHDALYEAIDIYLQEHSSLTKAEKKHLCGLMDVRKLTMDASMHAASLSLFVMSGPVQSVPTFSTLVLSRRGHVLHVEIAVGKVNAMNKAFWAECRSCFSWVGSDRHTRVVVISARGRIFSAGLDLQDHTDLLGTATSEDHSTKPDQARAYFHQREHVMSYQAAFTAIERCPQPVIAAVHGLCVGGAIDLITACDIRFCSADATFSIKEVDVGLAADVGTLARIHHVTGNNSLVRELVYTARPFSSTEAVQCGLVSRTYSTRDDLMKHALELATTIANKSPVAVYGSKVFLNYARDHTIHESLDYQATWNAAALGTGDIAESVTAAMSKKTPIYSNL